MLTITNEDCMELMARYPDKYFELSIVDPPYGIGDKLTQGGTWASKYKKGRSPHRTAKTFLKSSAVLDRLLCLQCVSTRLPPGANAWCNNHLNGAMCGSIAPFLVNYDTSIFLRRQVVRNDGKNHAG